MSNRLDSLNSKKPGTNASKPLLKFKPKVVTRKTQDERAKDAPTQVKEENVDRKPSQRGRGSMRGARGGRGRGNYAGTRLVSSGPLTEGSVSLGMNSTRNTIKREPGTSSSSPTPDFLQNLKVKREESVAKANSDESDSEDDGTKINMNRDYNFEEENVLFPIRPVRENDTSNEESGAESKETSPALVESRSATPMEKSQSPVKEEHIEDQLNKIKEYKAELETKITDSGDKLRKEESEKIESDFKQIVNQINNEFSEISLDETESGTSKDYMVIHLPSILPEFKRSSIVKDEDVKDENMKDEEVSVENLKEEDVKMIDEEPTRTKLAADIPNLRGRIGSLNIHKSGKISINLGNDNNLVVSKAAPANFLQELTLIDMKDTQHGDVEVTENDQKVAGSYYRLGKVNDKFIAIPSFN
ncbi:Piso0_000403 [Millerozyma farinosa CBS 7064]|uniref:Piso0_000403 protein n=1 Tax=Pichia sorbitophila (strain ATCC MYA-4447 / BCRC 22081 / CBS 7064 / NBRC 10061 / NRRL Y-12695) TaxID=559304 RepID=G8YTW9_PICSO|nr:Piso0_000403 [Millerozyma farinosa CBS 7064]CCE73370.1 Piso0_000403 [Millerozyma farinosa CBS 7064]